MSALRSATLWASECLGNDAVGALIPGRHADLVVVEVDPEVRAAVGAGNLPGSASEVLGDLSRFATKPRGEGRDARTSSTRGVTPRSPRPPTVSATCARCRQG